MTVRRKILMSVAVTSAFFLLLEGLLAVGGVRPKLYTDDPYVGFSAYAPLFVEDEDGEGRPIYRTADNKLTLFNRQVFPVRKAPGTVRIFCVGGSTTFGRPYDDRTSFAGWLRQILPGLDRSSKWEVLNAGGVSYASYRVSLLMEELARYEPDLFIIYSGHNEFLEERAYSQIIAIPAAVRGVGALAAHTRTHAVLTGVVESFRRAEAPTEETTLLKEEVTTLLDSSVGPSAFSRNDEQRRRAVEHYEFNLARMVDIAHSSGAAVVLVSPAANLGNCAPFKSQHRDDLTDAEKMAWNAELIRAETAMGSGDLDEMLAAVERAESLDDRFAHTHYQKGLVLRRMGRDREALHAFERALVEDVCPLRILPAMTEVVHRVAAERGVDLVDFDSVVKERSTGGIPGAPLFLDHVHPTIEANRLLAESIVDVLRAAGIVTAETGRREAIMDEVSRRIYAEIDEHSHALALMKLSKVLGWAGKLSEAERLARQAAAIFPDDSRIQYQAGLTAQLMQRREAAETHYRRAIALQRDADLPHQNLGLLLEEKGDFEEAVEHYRAALKNARILETAEVNTANLADALIGLGFMRYREGQFKEAVGCFSESDLLAPGRQDTVNRLAMSQMAGGLYREAVGSFNRCVSMAPEDAALWNRLAVACSAAGRIDEAAAAWREAVRLKPEIENSAQALPVFLRNSGRHDLAEIILERAEAPDSAP